VSNAAASTRVFASDLPGQTVSQDWNDGMTPYVGLLGHAGADYLGLGPFAPLVAKSLGFTARVGDPRCPPNHLRLGLQVVIIPFVPASNLFFKVGYR